MTECRRTRARVRSRSRATLPDAGVAATLSAEPAPPNVTDVCPAHAVGKDGAGAATEEDPPERSEIAVLAQALARIETSLAQRLAAADRNAAVIDRLHQEVQDFRQRRDARRIEPILRGLIHLRDDIQAMTEAVRRPERPATPEDLAHILGNFRLQVEEILYREGAEAFRPEVGDDFEAKRHQVIAMVPCEDAARNHTLSAVRQPGFTYDGRVLRPALVDVAKHVPPAEATDPPPAAPGSGATAMPPAGTTTQPSSHQGT